MSAAASGLILWRGDATRTGGWLRVVDGRIVQRGEGADWRSGTGLPALPPDEAAMLVLGVGDTALHWIACPGMTVRQGAAAAPLMALEASLGDAGSLHAAVAPAAEPESPHLVAVAGRDVMDAALGWCAAEGVADAAIVPAALLLPPPEAGFTAGLVVGQIVLRGTDCEAVADEPQAEFLVGEQPVRELEAGAVEAGLVAALGAPPLDLRQGGYARRGAVGVDGAWFRRLAIMIGFAALGSLLIALLTILKLNMAIGVLDAETVALARPLAPQAVDAADADRRLSAMLAARGGPGGFTATAAGLASAMRGKAGVHLLSLSRMADGSVRVQLAGPNSDTLNAVLLNLQGAGWRIAANAVRPAGNETIVDLTVTGG